MRKPYFLTNSASKKAIPQLYRNRQDIFFAIKKYFPTFTKHLIDDLLVLEEYSEEEIAFACGLTLDVVRNIVNNNYNKLSRREFQALFNLYAHVFCGWTAHRLDIQEQDTTD